MSGISVGDEKTALKRSVPLAVKRVVNTRRAVGTRRQRRRSNHGLTSAVS
jgi:hypothetical protein